MRLPNWLRRALRRALSMAELPPLGLYVHWPFCAAICPYCDFNVHLMRDGKDVDAGDWQTAYV